MIRPGKDIIYWGCHQLLRKDRLLESLVPEILSPFSFVAALYISSRTAKVVAVLYLGQYQVLFGL